HRRRRTDGARIIEGVGEEQRPPILAAGRKIRPERSSGDVRNSRCDSTRRQRRPGRSARLHARRPRVAASLGRRVKRWTENSASAGRQRQYGESVGGKEKLSGDQFTLSRTVRRRPNISGQASARATPIIRKKPPEPKRSHCTTMTSVPV